LLLRNLLNKILWDPREDPENYDILFIHRGVEDDSKSISMREITDITQSWFVYRDSGQEHIIPLHRVLRVTDIRRGKILWSKSK